MATLDQHKAALEKAVAAGDAKAAKEIAVAMKRQVLAESPPPSAKVVAAQGLAAKTGIGESMLIAAGRATDKIVQGGKQFFNERLAELPNTLPTQAMGAQKTLGLMAETEAEKDAIYKPLQEAHPYATGIGESAPLLAIPGGAGILTQAALGAAIGGSKYGTSADRVKEALLSGAGAGGGAIAGKALGKLIAPVNTDIINVTKRSAMGDAVKLGIRPMLSEVTGSATMRRIEDAAARVPGGAGVMEDFGAKNAKAINRVATKSVGQSGDEMTGQVFADASKALGKVFEDIKSLPGKVIKINNGVTAAADDILRQQSKMIPSQQDASLIKLATEARQMGAMGAKIDGERYQLVRSGLSEASYKADGTTKNHYGMLLDALDNAAEQSLSQIGRSDLAESLRLVRPQYATLKTLEKGTVTEGGNVSAQKVAAALRQNNPGVFRRGSNQSKLADVARYGEAFPPLRAGSPTMERQTIMDPITTAIMSGPAYVAANVVTNPVVTGYARHIGGTKAAKIVGEGANRSTRSVIDAMIERYLSPLRTNQHKDAR